MRIRADPNREKSMLMTAFGTMAFHDSDIEQTAFLIIIRTVIEIALVGATETHPSQSMTMGADEL